MPSRSTRATPTRWPRSSGTSPRTPRSSPRSSACGPPRPGSRPATRSRRRATLRTAVFERARARAPRSQTPLEVHAEVEATLVELLDEVPDSALDLPTLNGLTVRELVAHLAAMESLLAMWMGVPTLPEVEDERLEERTAAVVEVTRSWTFAEVIALWRRSMAAVRAAAPRRRDEPVVRIGDADRPRAARARLRDLDPHRRHPPGARACARRCRRRPPCARWPRVR